jgi:hypothetical protein
MNPFAHFDAVFVINLLHKIGRRERILQRLADVGAEVHAVHLIAGVTPNGVPKWWRDSWYMEGNGRTHRCRLPVGAYGALSAHHNALSMAASLKLKSVMILEDDAVFCRGFEKRMPVFMDLVPTDWDSVYLRSSLVSKLCEFEIVKTGVVRLLKGWSNVAVGYRGEYIKKAKWELWDQLYNAPPRSLDYRLACIQAHHHVYAANPGLVGHEAIDSDVYGGIKLSKREACVDDVSSWSKAHGRDGVKVGEMLNARSAAFGPA